MKVYIEGADILCLLDLYDSDLPAHLSVERPKSFSDQLFALTLLRRMGYARFAFVDQTVEGEQIHATTGLFSNDIPATMRGGFMQARATHVWLHVARALGAVIRRAPGLLAVAPRVRWFDIHVDLASPNA